MSDPLPSSAQPLQQRLLRALDEACTQLQQVKEARNEAIAVIGLGCRFPGGGNDADSLWELLRTGSDAVRRVPADRWDADAYADRAEETNRRIVSKEGGFLTGIDQFDPGYFGISPREASSMDPQHRVFIEVAVEALESAGYLPERLRGAKTGVFVGVTSADYSHLLRETGNAALLDGYFITGNTLNAAAGRVSYVLGLTGPSLAVDTACSSSLVSIHLACQSLRNGDCDVALAGGVNIILLPEGSVALSRAGMLSPDGRCKSFDTSADGYGRGEGCGVVVLRRLSAALRDGDYIHAVLRGSAVNQDGPSGGFTVPSAEAQEALIREALARAGLSPADVSYLEAHGTGTRLGDPIETGVLARVFSPGRPSHDPLLVGTVKTNIGHLESAAGIAGLIKVILALRHSELPPLAHFTSPNPLIGWDDLPLRLVTTSTPWLANGKPRRAGISSFGVSGTNAHLIVEEAPPVLPAARRERPWHVLALSAKSRTALAELCARFEGYLETQEVRPFGDVCFTANTGRVHHQYRTAVAARSCAEAAGQLRSSRHQAAESPGANGAISGAPRLTFLFPNEPLASPETIRAFCAAEPLVREFFEKCTGLLPAELAAPFTQFFAGEVAAHPVSSGLPGRVALYCWQHALAQLWISWGVEPRAVAGLGMGEYAAGSTASIFTFEEGLRLVLAADAALEPSIIFSRPTRSVLSARGTALGNEVATAHYWRQRQNQVATSLPADVLELCEGTIIVLGSQNLPARFLSSYHHDGPSLRPLHEALAAVYIRGGAVAWEALYRGNEPRRVPLPTYPWQRQRCWFEMTGTPLNSRAETTGSGTANALLSRCLRGENEGVAEDLAAHHEFTDAERALLPKILQALAGSGLTDPMADWFYQIVWEPVAPPRMSVAKHLQPPEQIRRCFSSQSAPSPEERGSMDIGPQLDRLCAAFAARALSSLGCDFTAGQRFTLQELAQRLGVLPKYYPLLQRLLNILREDRYLKQDGGQWETLEAPNIDAASCTTENLAEECPALRLELTLFARCAPQIAAVITGRCDPLRLLFPADEPVTAASLYHHSPAALRLNALIGESVSAALEKLPAQARVSVLEIGAGTGATTQAVLSHLPAKRTDYCFTDLSPSFVSDARRTFADRPFVRPEVLDIEKDPATQGLALGSNDIVIAANVLHATADVRAALRHARSLLAPGGLLILRESVESSRTADLVFGLTEGWWRFTDHDLRPAHPLLSTEQWITVLRANGFDEVSATSKEETRSQESLLLARADAGASAAASSGVSWILLADRQGVAERVAARLRERGDGCLLVFQGGPGEIANADTIVLNPDHAESFRSLFGELRAREATGVLHFWALDARGSEASEEAEALCRRTFHLAQALLTAGFSAMPSLTMCTRGAMPVADAAPSGFAHSVLWGLGRILALEHPECAPRLIDLDPAEPEEELENLLGEIMAGKAEPQVAWRGGKRFVARLGSSTARPLPSPLEFQPDASYLITGGLGGLGLAVAEWMIARGARRIVLSGRSAPDAETMRHLERLGQSGAKLVVAQADISVRADVERVLGEIAASGWLLRGVIHAAGVLHDGVFLHLTWENFRDVLRPKVAGAWHLHMLTKSLPLDFFVFFSSATALLGSPGQANHMTANTFLDALAHHRRAQGLPALSINWGPWAAVGAAARRNLAERVGAQGVGMIAPSQGVEAFERLLAGTAVQVGVVPLDWARVPPGLATQPFFSRFARRVRQTARTDAPFLRDFRSATAGRKEDLLLDLIRGHVAKVLGLSSGTTVSASESLLSLGLDSLNSVELRNYLQKSLEVELPSTLAYDHPTIEQISAFLLGKLNPSEPAPSSPVPLPSHVDREPAATGLDLDALSEDELGGLLEEELRSLNLPT